MKMFRSLTLLLSTTSLLIGCKTAPQPPAMQTRDREPRSSNRDQYDRTYQAESRHHHHHGKRDETNDSWTGYDRPGSAAETSRNPDAGDYQPGQNNSQSSRRRHNTQAVTAAPGQFDFYVLNLSWSPEFCHGHPNAAECAQHRAFTLHGLWPQNNDGTYPEDCSEAPGPVSPSQYADIYPDAALLQHEWQTHGTCSGLTPDPFFALARRAEQSIRIPEDLTHPSQQSTLTPAQIITEFTRSNPSIPASSLAISCGNNYLTAIEVCLDKNLKPESCSAVKTCGANQIRIPAPQ